MPEPNFEKICKNCHHIDDAEEYTSSMEPVWYCGWDGHTVTRDSQCDNNAFVKNPNIKESEKAAK